MNGIIYVAVGAEISRGYVCGIDRYPRSFCGSELILRNTKLTLHDPALLDSILSADSNGRYTYSGSEPEASDARDLPKSIALLSGSSLIVMALIFLKYCVNRADYFIIFGVIGGFLPFCVGVLLVLFCFLPDPPTIFGLTIGP